MSNINREKIQTEILNLIIFKPHYTMRIVFSLSIMLLLPQLESYCFFSGVRVLNPYTLSVYLNNLNILNRIYRKYYIEIPNTYKGKWVHCERHHFEILVP